jgi:hypothetical protein
MTCSKAMPSGQQIHIPVVIAVRGTWSTASFLGKPVSFPGHLVEDKQRFNPVIDDLSKGTVTADWIPRYPGLHQRRFLCECGTDASGGGIHSDYCPKARA